MKISIAKQIKAVQEEVDSCVYSFTDVRTGKIDSIKWLNHTNALRAAVKSLRTLKPKPVPGRRFRRDSR